MRRFSEISPAAAALWYLSVMGIAMFCNYPILAALTIAGGCMVFIMTAGKGHGREHLFFWLLFAVLAIANPLTSHNGRTVLFVMNNNPVTLEAMLYGLNSAALIVGVLYLLRSFTMIMTADRLLYLTGFLSPKLSLTLSMALRFVPLFGRQWQKISDAQRAMGLYRDNNFLDDLKGRMRIFSILVTWALENGITTADSMEARGYGCGRRSQLRQYRTTFQDAVFMAADAVLTGVCVFAVCKNGFRFGFYPDTFVEKPGIKGICGIIAFGLLILMPLVTEGTVKLIWRYLQSRV